MAKGNPLKDKSYAFAIAVVGLCKQLRPTVDPAVRRQLLKSATSIGANVEEALQAQSTKDFVSKLCISLKEAVEAHYWLRLIRDTERLKINFAQYISDVEELIKLLTAIIRTTKSKL